MLNDAFLTELRERFPEFYTRANEQAMHDASRLRAESGGDLERALLKARLEGAAGVWWPYVKASVPFVGRRMEAMEAFTRLVLTVDHVVGYQPPDMDAARRQVLHVLENTMDTEKLKRLVGLDKPEEKAAAGAFASMTALIAPVRSFTKVKKAIRFVPVPLRVAIGAAILVTLASVPLMAGLSAGQQAERAARNFGELPREAPRT